MANNRTLNGRAQKSVEHHTANFTLTADDSGTIHTNKGASGGIVAQLPAVADGLEFLFVLRAAQTLQIEPNGTDTISLPSTGVPETAGDYIVADAIGESVRLIGVDGNWTAFGHNGTWTGQ
jgi:hypothetical protein